ncbi:MAG: hypothetical protein ACNFW9_03620 [Candidatus Kerfeldbacteria bacterium]|jgi:DNA-directed RNA polymerase subunit RPC12/RpoP
MEKILKIKKDKYKSSRGGYSRLLDISCQKCNNKILVYQKDGPGNLRRLYMDRIFSPSSLVELHKKDIKKISPLKCNKCGFIMGMPYIYDKEKRKAFRIFQDAVTKKIIKNN